MVRIEVVQKVAPAFKDGVLVLVLRQLVVNVVESDGFGIRRLAFVPPYSVFCSISFRCGGLSIERNQKPLAPKITLAATHHDRQKQVEVKRSSRVNPHEIRLFSGCPYAVVKQGTKKFTKNKPYKGFSRFRTDLSLVGLTCALYVLFLIVIILDSFKKPDAGHIKFHNAIFYAHCRFIQHGKLGARRKFIAIELFVLQFSFMFFPYLEY